MKKLLEKLYLNIKNGSPEVVAKKQAMFKRMLQLIARASGYDKSTSIKFSETGKFSVLKNPTVFIEDGPAFQRIQKEYVKIAYQLGANEQELDQLQEAVIDQAILNNKIAGYKKSFARKVFSRKDNKNDLVLHLMADEVYPQKYVSGKAFLISPSNSAIDEITRTGIAGL